MDSSTSTTSGASTSQPPSSCSGVKCTACQKTTRAFYHCLEALCRTDLCPPCYQSRVTKTLCTHQLHPSGALSPTLTLCEQQELATTIHNGQARYREALQAIYERGSQRPEPSLWPSCLERSCERRWPCPLLFESSNNNESPPNLHPLPAAAAHTQPWCESAVDSFRSE
jgi:hypothetical protein